MTRSADQHWFKLELERETRPRTEAYIIHSQTNFTFQISAFLLNGFAHTDGDWEKYAVKQTLYFLSPPPTLSPPPKTLHLSIMFLYVSSLGWCANNSELPVKCCEMLTGWWQTGWNQWTMTTSRENSRGRQHGSEICLRMRNWPE